jgi:hypothetical protein
MPAGSLPPSPSTRKRTGPLGRLERVLGQPQQRPHDLHEGDVVAGSRDSVSWTRAIVRMRRTDSSTPPWPRRMPPPACSRSSDEIVCRLFFTRWWISRMVASFDSSSRSALRSS